MVAILRRPDGLIGERQRLAALLPPIRQRLDLLNDPLEQASRIEPAALGGPLYDLGNWSQAPVLAYFPGDFDWIAPVADKAGPWASEQEPQVFSAAQESLLGIDRWSALVAETVAEEDTLDEEVPTMPRGWWDIGAHLAWLFKYNKKEIIKRLMEKVPLLRALSTEKEAADLWRRAADLFDRFIERIFKEGRILAPLWEFFLGVIGLMTPGEFVKDIADRAGSLLGKILKSALKFLKNLGKAIGGGINLFRARIGEHLMGVFQEWLFGELDLTGPFNLRTLLKALLEQVGISLRNVYEHIAAYVSEHIRPITAEVVEEKVQNALKTIEKAAGAIRTAMHWLQLLMGGKYAELWEEIKAYLSELWSRIWEEARSKLIEYIIKELRAKLLKLLDPTGISQVLEGIKWLYDAIKTVIAYGERILAMVRQVFGAIKDIADEKIDEAAALVERALVFGTSVVFSFLARALGLDKAVQEFKNALKGLKKYVDRGLSALVRAAGKAWEWIVGKVEEIKEWWEGRRKFTDQDGNTREIYFDPANSDHPDSRIRSRRNGLSQGNAANLGEIHHGPREGGQLSRTQDHRHHQGPGQGDRQYQAGGGRELQREAG